jgi:L-amino acid N-acyltransferase YncA
MPSGFGSKTVDYMIEICKNMGFETVYGVMLSPNYRAIALMKEMGFAVERQDDTVKATLNLKEEAF